MHVFTTDFNSLMSTETVTSRQFHETYYRTKQILKKWSSYKRRRFGLTKLKTVVIVVAERTCVDWMWNVTSSFSNLSGKAVHTYLLSRRFQILPLWRAFSDSSVFSGRKRRIRVDDTRNRKNILAFSNSSGIVWTGPKKAVTCTVNREHLVLVEPLWFSFL